MKAEVGDRIVVASGTLHRPIRDGEILQVGEGGGGPYLCDGQMAMRVCSSQARTLMSNMSLVRLETAMISRAPSQGQVPNQPRLGASTSISTRMRTPQRLTPCCAATCQARLMYAGRLGAVRLIRTCPRSATRWP